MHFSTWLFPLFSWSPDFKGSRAWSLWAHDRVPDTVGGSVFFFFFHNTLNWEFLLELGKFLNVSGSSNSKKFPGLCLCMASYLSHLHLHLLRADLLFTAAYYGSSFSSLEHSYVTIPSFSPVVWLRVKLSLFTNLALQMDLFFIL